MPRVMYCSPEKTVKAAVIQMVTRSTGRAWRYGVSIATSTVRIWKNVDSFPARVGAGAITPPVMWISTAPRTRITSREITTAVIQNGSARR